MLRMTRDNWLMLAVLTAFIVVFMTLVYIPQGLKLDSLNSQVVSQQLSLETDVQKACVVPAMLRQVEEMKRRYKNFDRRLPKRQELAGFLREISRNMDQEKLSNQLMKPGDPSYEELFHTLPIIMQFHGPYLSLTDFLKRLDQMERLARIKKLVIDANNNDQDENLDIELQMNIYFTES